MHLGEYGNLVNTSIGAGVRGKHQAFIKQEGNTVSHGRYKEIIEFGRGFIIPTRPACHNQLKMVNRQGNHYIAYSSTAAAAVSAATFSCVKNPLNPLKRCTYSIMREECSDALEKICLRPCSFEPMTSSRKP